MEKAKIKHMLLPFALAFAMTCANAQKERVYTDAILKAQLGLLQLPQDFEFIKDTTGFSKFKNSKFYAKNGDVEVFTIDANKVHLIDFNHDGLKDIVYEERQLHTATVLFANNGANFIEIWNGPGKPVCITQAENTTISVYSPYVGCMEINLLFELTIGANNKISEDLLSYHHNTQLTNLDADFKQKVVTGILRTTPIEDNTETKDPCTGEQRLGNQIRTIEKQKVTVIKEKGDWLLVVYKNNNNKIVTWLRNKIN